MHGILFGVMDPVWIHAVSSQDPPSFQPQNPGNEHPPTLPLFFPVFPPLLLLLLGSKAHSRCFGDNLELKLPWNPPDQLPAPSLYSHRSSFPYLGALPGFPPFPLFSLALHFPMPFETHSCTSWEEPSAATSNWGS